MSDISARVGKEAMGPTTDEELRAMMQEHHPASFGWARVCGARAGVEAEDVLQTVYVKILSGQARFDGRSSFRTWLFSVIRHTALDERRRSGRWWRRLLGAEETVDGVDRSPDQRNHLERAETMGEFRMALARLPERQREVLHLVFYQDMSIQEAAVVMGVSVGSARTHYERGKRRLREWLGEREGRHE